MVWHTDKASGLQLPYPGGWERKSQSIPGLAGKITYLTFQGPVVGEEGRYRFGQALWVTIVHNAATHPLPFSFKSSALKGEIATQTLARDPDRLAQVLSRSVLRWIFNNAGFQLKEISVNPWSAKRGKASFCLGQASGEDRYGNRFVGFSLGFYDPFSDTFGSLLMLGPYTARGEIEQLSKAVFNLALFGGVIGIPQPLEGSVSAQEYQTRVEAFLQAGAVSRAWAEAQVAIEVYPNEAELHHLAGQALRRMGRLPEALASYRRASELRLSTLELELSLGATALGLGEWQTVWQAHLRALRIKPGEPLALIGCGLSLLHQGKVDEAASYFERARVEAPHLEQAQYYDELGRALQGKASGRLVGWFKPEGLRRGGFPVPAGWAFYGLDEGETSYRAFFTPEALELDAPQMGEGLLYLRRDRASTQSGRPPKELKPEKVAEEFILDEYEKSPDPQKVLQFVTMAYQRGADRYAIGEIGYTQAARRWTVRILSYYQPARDRLHVLMLRVAGTDLGSWEPFAEACFQTASFD